MQRELLFQGSRSSRMGDESAEPKADVLHGLRSFQVRQGAPAINHHALRPVKTRGCSEGLHPRRQRKIAELLPRGGKDNNRGLGNAVFRGIRCAKRFVVAANTSQIRRWVKHNNRMFRRSQFLRQHQPEGLFHHVRLGFIGEPQNSDRIIPRPVRLHELS